MLVKIRKRRPAIKGPLVLVSFLALVAFSAVPSPSSSPGAWAVDPVPVSQVTEEPAFQFSFDHAGTSQDFGGPQGMVIHGSKVYYTASRNSASNNTVQLALVGSSNITTAATDWISRWIYSPNTFTIPPSTTTLWRDNALGHANDIAVNPNTGRLAVPVFSAHAAQNPNGSNDPNGVYILDNTGYPINQVSLPYPVQAICFDSFHNRYATVGGGQVHFYTADFQLAANDGALTFSATTDGTGQSIDCDRQYLYSVRSGVGTGGYNQIAVFAWTDSAGNLVQGTQVRRYEYQSTLEGEAVSHWGGIMYHAFINGSTGGTVKRVKNFQYTLHFLPNGATSGSMPDQIILYGHQPQRISPNAFVRSGKTFAGWSGCRSYDSKCAYENPANTAQSGWYTQGQQPSGWRYYLWGNNGGISGTSPYGMVNMTAQWN